MDGIRRGFPVFVHHLDFRGSSWLSRVVTLELQIGLQCRIDLVEAAPTAFEFVDQLDSFEPCQRGKGIDGVWIDVAVRKAGVDFLVADPAAFASGVDELDESGIWTN